MYAKKLTALVLVLILALPTLLSCAGSKGYSLSVADFEVPEHVYKYIVLNSRADIEGRYGKSVWDGTKADKAKAELEEQIRSALAQLYTVCALGKERGIEWDSELIKTQAELKYEEYLVGYESEKQFTDDLKLRHMTKDTFMFIISNEILAEEVYSAIIDSDEKYTDEVYLKSLFESDTFIRVKQIFIDPQRSSETAAKEKIEEIKDKLDSGEDFDELCEDFNHDINMFSNPDGYYIMRGTRDLKFEEAAFALSVGETSDVVKTDAGYNIIKRYEKDPAYIEDHFDSLASEFYETLYTEKYEEKFASVLESITSLPEAIDIVSYE